MRCPVCRADNTTGPQCRRCRADLALLFALEERRAHLLAAAQAALQQGDAAETHRLATAAERLRRGDKARRLVALGRLLAGDFAGAWQSYAGEAAPVSEGMG